MDFNTSWEEDYEARTNPTLLTQLLHESVPVLKFVGWQVIEVGEGFTKSLLPLNLQSTNQHGTHQAAIIVLSADYTGGIALGTLFRGVPIIGVHPCPSEESASLWLAKVTIDYLAPSTDHLVVTCRVPVSKIERIRKRYFSGNRVIESLEMECQAGETQVANASLVYFAKQSKMLRPRSLTEAANPLFTHSIKSSARMIAGVRATEHHLPERIYSDPYSTIAAGTHGRLLSDIFLGLLPQLREMIVARTKDLDDRLDEALATGIKQIVTIGVGLDFRTFRLVQPDMEVRIFELDLPDMLIEREKVLATMPTLPFLMRTTIAIDLKGNDLSQLLLHAEKFDPLAPTFFVLEGVSMYLEDHIIRDTLDSIRAVMCNKDSRLWIDMVSRSAVDQVISFPGSDEFFKGMSRLGEPFIFGHDQPAEFFADLGFATVESHSSGQYRQQADPLLDQYRFYLLSNSDHPDLIQNYTEPPTA